jgi:hypothetical protein
VLSSTGLVEIEHHGGGKASKHLFGNAPLLERRAASRRRRDALFSQLVHLFGDGSIFRRHLHPQGGVQALAPGVGRGGRASDGGCNETRDRDQ